MDDRQHAPREGSHGVQWGLAAALVLMIVATGVVAWRMGSSNQLGGTSWVLTELPHSEVGIAGHTVTVSFTADELTGQAPVNTYSGEYTAGGTVFKVGDIALTRMAGSEPAMALEGAYFDALTNVTAYVYDEETLTFLDPDGVVFLVFERSQ
ncbi:MAG: META domain-containing protein [Coriobacteriia bacterium]|nr:META domain-containing protein [Coriobacteriia bacterium]